MDKITQSVGHLIESLKVVNVVNSFIIKKYQLKEPLNPSQDYKLMSKEDVLICWCLRILSYEINDSKNILEG